MLTLVAELMIIYDFCKVFSRKLRKTPTVRYEELRTRDAPAIQRLQIKLQVRNTKISQVIMYQIKHSRPFISTSNKLLTIIWPNGPIFMMFWNCSYMSRKLKTPDSQKNDICLSVNLITCLSGHKCLYL